MIFSSLHKIVHRIIEETDTEIKKFGISNIDKIRGHSNNILRLQLDDGRMVIIKQSEYDWAHPRFFSACNASFLLRRHSSVISPQHIHIPQDIVQKPTLAYWYLSYPTLKDLWPRLSVEQKRGAIKSLGQLLRKMHAISLESYGLVHHKHTHGSLTSLIVNDLHERLKPTFYAKWPEVVPILDQLIVIIKKISNDEKKAVLVHNDLHMGNILCKTGSNCIECIGFLDWEEAKGGRWESDIASAMILHHPLFEGTSDKVEWLNGFNDFLKHGYERNPDPTLLCFFQIYHLLNLGLFSVMNGDKSHASLVLEEVKERRDRIFQ